MINKIINNKYIVNSLIGTGGMAEVYMCTRVETRETVAIKMLRKEFLNNTEFIKMFNKEALISQQIFHKNIVNTLDVGTYENCPYIVMEYVKGETLKEYIKRKIVLTEEETLKIAIQVCDALIYAHDKGLVHRDIKPQNILLNEDMTAKIGDFGIAKIATSSTVTMSGSSVVGSVHYMSPEQAMGHHVGNTADIYSLGIAMYEMLTGSVPFKGESPVAIALRHVNEDLAPPKSINTSISESVDKIILKASDKVQEFRYTSAQAMKDDLVKALEDKSGDFVMDNEDMGATRQHPVITKDMLSKAYQSSERFNGTNGTAANTNAGTNAGTAHYEETAEEKKFPVIKYLIGAIITVFVLIGIFAIVQWSSPQEEPQATKQMILIPSVEGQSLDEATRLLKVLGIEFDINYVTDDTKAADIVLIQSPQAEQMVDINIKMTLTVSKGPELFPIPDVSNMYFIEAIDKIEKAGFTVGSISQEISTDAIDYITRQLPKPGTQAPKGEEVDIWLSAKSNTGNIMPNLIGQSYQNAYYLISALDGYIDTVETEYVNSGYDKGVVINQEPLLDTELAPEQIIKLYISNGEGEKYIIEKQVLVSLHKEESHVVILLNDDGVSMTVYDDNLAKGDHEILLNLSSNTPGEKELTIFCDGEEIGRDRVMFEVTE